MMPKRSTIIIAVLLAAGVGACAPTITPPPPAMALAPFYRQYLDARGIPVTGSGQVSPAALRRARDIVVEMLADRPDIRAALVNHRFRVAIMAETEGTTDLPEQAAWKKPTRDDPALTFCERKHYDVRIGRLSDRDYWNGRARGMGGELTSGAEENLLAKPGTRYFGENIFVHEFSHAVMAGIAIADPELFALITTRYAEAKARGLWKGEYAETTAAEYWAEGSQFWFNSNRLAVVDGRRILSHDDLKAYDPALYDLLARVYGTRHRLRTDAFYNHPARVPPGVDLTAPGPLKATAEQC